MADFQVGGQLGTALQTSSVTYGGSSKSGGRALGLAYGRGDRYQGTDAISDGYSTAHGFGYAKEDSAGHAVSGINGKGETSVQGSQHTLWESNPHGDGGVASGAFDANANALEDRAVFATASQFSDTESLGGFGDGLAVSAAAATAVEVADRDELLDFGRPVPLQGRARAADGVRSGLNPLFNGHNPFGSYFLATGR
ncbi:hypothetical protein A3770_07p49490 [Chloropicon primus]|uniref:Uncharacterized protein n=1 Tax=Chloropicon primus TaxID=1764295 RepID=A0A5B8MQ10_9CHLO|nr:hypothetical protein A3770_07p49490 [Chloropicon primus]|eukprot:QDZ22431.1 hypothetical protein A3770_07p49490 [Chloropicon primus]